MPSLEKDGRTLLPDDLAGEGDVVLVLYPHIGEYLGLVPVGRDELAYRKKFLLERTDIGLVVQVVAYGGDHDGVYDQRDVVVLEGIRDDTYYLGVVKHAGLYCLYVAVGQHGVELCLHDVCRHGEYVADLTGVLCGYSGDDGGGVDADGGHGLDIRLDACSSDRIRTRHRKSGSHVSFPMPFKYIIIERGVCFFF